ncbi:helix-turn-helix domain-containing protein [Henriciella aquimarina]|uniref:helix-turn-helix domain-containing protein n=1 Tax=Henriciella aquimarina TaxID=545261 RepID=UPI000A016ACD|nr:helix-turn-helix domain-containing protein [Henriciella aquimarina]
MSDDERENTEDRIEDSSPETRTAAPETGAEEDSNLIDAFTAGGRLRAAREARGLSIEDVSKKILINRRILESLEQTIQPPDHDMRRTRIVARAYATELGLDPDMVLADFPVEEEKDLATAIPKSSVTVSERKRGRYLIPVSIAAGLVVAAGVSVIMLTPGQTAETRNTPSVAERVMAVNTAQESLFAPEPLTKDPTAGKIDLSIVALRPAWIEVRGADGTIFRSRMMAKDEAYYPRVGAGWTVTVQDASAFQWRIDDEPAGRMAEEAVPVYSASIDEAAALAAEQRSPALATTSNSRPAR